MRVPLVNAVRVLYLSAGQRSHTEPFNTVVSGDNATVNNTRSGSLDINPVD